MAFASTSGNHFVPVLLKSKASVLRRRSNKIWLLIQRITIWVETTSTQNARQNRAGRICTWYLHSNSSVHLWIEDREVPSTPRHTKTSVAQWNSRIVGCSSIVWLWACWRLGLGAGVGLRGRLLIVLALWLLIVLALCWNSGRSPALADFSLTISGLNQTGGVPDLAGT